MEVAGCYSSTATILSHNPPHRPAFFSSNHRKSQNSPSTITDYRPFSTFDKHFRQDAMAQATHSHPINIGDGNSHCGNITGSFNTTFYKSDEDAQVMCWLSPLEPSNRHQGVRTGRFCGVGDWFLETRAFRGWRGGTDKAVLFCSGNPGVGKTYLR